MAKKTYCEITYCGVCGKVIKAYSSGRPRFFCSYACVTEHRKMEYLKTARDIVRCEYCGKFFGKLQYQIRQSKRHFCNTYCSQEYSKDTPNPSQKRDKRKHGQKEFMTNRILAFQRDGYRCQYCGVGLRDTVEGEPVKLHADHIIPLSKGGTHDLNNLKTACQICNLGKSDLILGVIVEQTNIVH